MSSTSTRTFEYKDDKSSKFWEVTHAESTVTVRYGKTGTNGQAQEKVFDDAAVASKYVAKLIAAKTGKGYVERGRTSSARAKAVLTSATSAEGATQPASRSQTKKAPTINRTGSAQDPEATPESLMALFGKDDATNRLLAKHPRASAELLEKLSHSSDQATRRGVASNPNTLPETLVRLGQQFPKEFLANPALDLLLLVNPALMVEVPEALLTRLLKQSECPASLLIWAAGHPLAKIQLAVAMNAKAPLQALEKLRRSEHTAVLESVQALTRTDPEQDPEEAFENAVKERLRSMASHDLAESWSSGDIGLAQWNVLPLSFRLSQAVSDYAESATVVRMMSVAGWSQSEVQERLPGFEGWDDVAKDEQTGLAVLKELAKDTRAHVRAAVAASPRATTSLLKVLAEDLDHSVRSSVAFNPHTPAILLAQLAEDSNVNVRICVAANRNAPAQVFEVLAGDRNRDVRCDVALNVRTPSHVLEVLAKDTKSDVREMLAKNTGTPSTVLSDLVQDSSKHIREALARNPNTPSSALEILAKESQAWLRIEVAKNPGCPASVLEALARDANPQVRDAVAQNLAAPGDVLEALLATDDRGLLWELTKNPATPATALEILSRQDDPWIQTEVAEHPALPEDRRNELLEALSKRPSEQDRERVAKNPAVPCTVLETLSRDSKIGVRCAVASNPKCPSVILHRLARDASAVQQAVARNLNTSLDVLVQLSASSFSSVRWQVAAHAHRSPEIFKALSSDPDEDVRRGLASCRGLSAEGLDELLQGFQLEQHLMSLFLHPNLGHASAQVIATKLFDTPAKKMPWFLQELAKASEEVQSAVEEGQVLAYFGKDPNKEILAKRSLAAIMALCSGPHVEASRIAKVIGSTDWLTRAAVAQNPGTPPNLFKKLSADPHPLVSALASRRIAAEVASRRKCSAAGAEFVPINLGRIVDETLQRMRGDGFGWTCIPLINSRAWTDRANLDEILSWLKRVEAFDELIDRLVSGLEAAEREFFWRWAAGAKDAEVRMRLVKHPSVPPEALQRFVVDESVGVLLTVARKPGLPKALKTEAEKAAIRAITKKGRSFRVMVASNAATLTLAVRERLTKDSDWAVKEALKNAVVFPEWMTRDNTSEESDQTSSAETVEPSYEDTDDYSFLRDEVGSRRALDWLDQLRRAFQREFLVSQGKQIARPAPLTVMDVSNALTWLGYVPGSDKDVPSKSARSTDWLTRLGAALHPGATKGVLKLLREDVDPDVARAAQLRESDEAKCDPRTIP